MDTATLVALATAAFGIVFLLWLIVRTQRSKKASQASVLRFSPSKVETTKTGQRYLVIGGHGFLGSHIVEALLARGEEDIHVFDANDSPLFKKEADVSFIKGDILNRAHLENACMDRDVVFHTAAMLNYWSRMAYDFDPVYQVNYIGTKNVVDACIKMGVQKLLFPSSATIFLTADALSKPVHNLTEDDARYPEKPLCHYTHTKMLAEKAVLAANGTRHRKGSGCLLTGVLRPNAIYGPRDLFSNLIGSGYPGVGTPTNKQDYAYVENVIHAFFKLEEKLTPGSQAAGQAYFISDDAPIGYLTFARQFGKRFGHEFHIIPHYVATALGHVVEFLTRITSGRLPLGQLKVLTPPTLLVSRAEYYCSVEKAKRELGWRPLYSPEEGINLSVRYHIASRTVSPAGSPTATSATKTAVAKNKDE